MSLASYDLIWSMGGNTFCLREAMKVSGFDEIIQRLLASGHIYGGASAGAIVTAPTIGWSTPMENPEQASEYVRQGLGLVDFCPIPHITSPKYRASARIAAALAREEGYEIEELRDGEAIIVNGPRRLRLGENLS